ncbi:MAG: hypothetical protein NT167_24180, partial [Verrucomicrobia bacterium]|nr:hypothetical protein [Verrucomicrobiota bacterium]
LVPNTPDVLVGLARCAYQTHSRVSALHLLRRAEVAAPALQEPHQWLNWIYRELGRDQDAAAEAAMLGTQ